MKTAACRILAVIVCLVAIPPMTLAAEDDMREHPYLFFTKRDVPRLKERLEDPEIARMWQVVQDAALRRRRGWPAGGNVLCAGIAYHLTGDRKYAEAGMDRVMALVTSGRPWFTSANLHLRYCDLTTSYRTWPIAYGYDMFYDVMTEEQRRLCREALRTNVFAPFMKAHAVHDTENRRFTDEEGRSEWWANSYANWNSQVNGAIGLAALATLDDIPEAAEVLEMARASLKYVHYESDQGEEEDGGWDEGPMYWGAAVGFATRFYAALENVTGTDDGFFDLPGIRKTVQFYIDFASPEGKWVSFADCNDRLILDPISAIYILAARYDSPEYMRQVDDNATDWHALPFGVLLRQTIPTPPPEPRPRARWYRDIQWALLCSDGLYLPFKGGDLGAAHGHLDANSLLLWVDGERMLNDPGYGKKQTEDHNSLLVNGAGQRRGAGTRNFGEHTTAFARILNCGTVGGDSYLVSEAASCYGGELARYQRHVVLAEDGYVVVFDDVEAAGPATFTVNWHTLFDLTTAGDGRAVIRGRSASLHLAAAADSPLETSTGRTRFDRAFRVGSAGSVKAWRLFTVLAPAGAPEVEVSFSEEEASVTVNGREHTFARAAEGGYRYAADAVIEAPRPGQ